MRPLVALSLLAALACSSTTAVSRRPSATDRDELNARLAGHAALVALLPPLPPAIVCERAELQETSLKVLRAEPREVKVVPYDAVQSVKLRDPSRGALEGTLFGLGVGAVLGAGALLPRALGDTADTMTIGKGAGLLVGAGAGAVIGGVIGYLAGKGFGHTDTFTFTGFAQEK